MRYGNIPNSKKFFYYEKPRKTSFSWQPPSTYIHMFTEDIRIGIMPIGGRSENPKFAIKLVPSDPVVEVRIVQGINHSNYIRDQLTESICDFVEHVAFSLAYSGGLIYEIVYLYADENKDNVVGFTLDHIDPRCIRNFCGFYWQFLPRKEIPDKEHSRFNYARGKDLIILKFPQSLGGPSKLRKLLKTLKWLSNNLYSKFAIEQMAAKPSASGFDFKIFMERQENLLAFITRHTGWNARRLFSERALEFHQLYRYLKFEKTKAILRNYIIGKLNEALVVIGKKMNFNAAIIVEGLPSPLDYDIWISQLLEGTLSFSDAIEKTRY